MDHKYMGHTYTGHAYIGEIFPLPVNASMTIEAVKTELQKGCPSSDGIQLFNQGRRRDKVGPNHSSWVGQTIADPDFACAGRYGTAMYTNTTTVYIVVQAVTIGHNYICHDYIGHY